MNARNRHHTIENCVRCRALATAAPAPAPAPRIVPDWLPAGFRVDLDTRVGLVVCCERCEASWKAPHGPKPCVEFLSSLSRHLYTEHPRGAA